MKYQFKHLHKNHQVKSPKTPSYCIAMDIPPKSWLLEVTKKKFEDLSNLSVIIALDVGYSKCSIDDKYVKDIGRALSIKNIRERDFLLSTIELQDEAIFLTFKNLDKELPVDTLKLKIHKNSGKIYFIDATQKSRK